MAKKIITKSQLRKIIKEEIQSVLSTKNNADVVSEGILSKIGEFFNVYWEGAKEHLARGDKGGDISGMYASSMADPFGQADAHEGRADDIRVWAGKIYHEHGKLSTGRLGISAGPQMERMREAAKLWRKRGRDLLALGGVVDGVQGKERLDNPDFTLGVAHLKATQPKLLDQVVGGNPEAQSAAAQIQPRERITKGPGEN